MEPIDKRRGETKYTCLGCGAKAVDFCGDVDVTWKLYGIQNLQVNFIITGLLNGAPTFHELSP